MNMLSKIGKFFTLPQEENVLRFQMQNRWMRTLTGWLWQEAQKINCFFKLKNPLSAFIFSYSFCCLSVWDRFLVYTVQYTAHYSWALPSLNKRRRQTGGVRMIRGERRGSLILSSSQFSGMRLKQLSANLQCNLL